MSCSTPSCSSSRLRSSAKHLANRPLLHDAALGNLDDLRAKLKRLADSHASPRAPVSSSAATSPATLPSARPAWRCPNRRRAHPAARAACRDRRRSPQRQLHAQPRLSGARPRSDREAFCRTVLLSRNSVMVSSTISPLHPRVLSAIRFHKSCSREPSGAETIAPSGRQLRTGPLMRRNKHTWVHSPRELVFAEHNPSCIRPHKSCDRSQHRRLSAAGGPKEHGPRLRQRKLRIESQSSRPMLDPHLQSEACYRTTSACLPSALRIPGRR